VVTERQKLAKVQMICGTCGSTQVSRDAWADWDDDQQQWVLGAVFDYGHCHQCEGKSHIRAVEIV
jgi:hypothetical protein